MTRDQLIQLFRVASRDWVGPYLIESHEWDTRWVIEWLVEAQNEACIRGRLLHESANPDLCEIAVIAGIATYSFHPRMYEITHAHMGDDSVGASRRLRLISSDDLDRVQPGWRTDHGCPEYLLQDETTLRLNPTPIASNVLFLEGYRLPDPSFGLSGCAVPEIHTAHHQRLIYWALYRAFSIPGALHNTALADRAEREFSQYFGDSPGGGLRRITQEDTPHHNLCFWV